MSTSAKLWLIVATIYGVFVFWYTDLGGPVTETEIQRWKQTMLSNGARAERVDYFEQFLREDTGRQFLMINAIDLIDSQTDSAEANSSDSSRQLMNRYLAHMLGELLAKASHPVIIGTATFTAIDLVGIEGAQQWDQGAVFRYKSRRAFMQIIANPITQEKHHYKLAALEKTIAYPIEPGFYLGDLRLILGLLLLSVTALLDRYWVSKKLQC